MTASTEMKKERVCRGPHCDERTMHTATYSDQMVWGWKCNNCGKHTPIRKRPIVLGAEAVTLLRKCVVNELNNWPAGNAEGLTALADALKGATTLKVIR